MEGEVLDAEELDEVAGGTLRETLDDRTLLKQMGAYDFDKGQGFAKTLQNGFAKLGDKFDMKITVDVNLNKNIANKYYLNGKEISRNELWSILKEGSAANK